MVMKLKTVTVEGKTYAEVEDGKPVYIHDDGKEVPFDAVTTVSRISTLNREAQSHREAKEAAEASLKTFEGLDPEKARKAVEGLSGVELMPMVIFADTPDGDEQFDHGDIVVATDVGDLHFGAIGHRAALTASPGACRRAVARGMR